MSILTFLSSGSEGFIKLWEKHMYPYGLTKVSHRFAIGVSLQLQSCKYMLIFSILRMIRTYSCTCWLMWAAYIYIYIYICMMGNTLCLCALLLTHNAYLWMSVYIKRSHYNDVMVYQISWNSTVSSKAQWGWYQRKRQSHVLQVFFYMNTSMTGGFCPQMPATWTDFSRLHDSTTDSCYWWQNV